MATFTWRPSYSAQGETTARVVTVKFGDGYQQRAGDGINTLPRTWSVQFKNFDRAVADQIDAFLRARGGIEAFVWQPPLGTTSKWLCGKWQLSSEGPYLASISATFEEVFE
jgi:phage-related protein